jgi:two-component system invasion response regulator UvrY
MEPNRIHVAYCDDHIAVRKGIIACIESDSDISVIVEGNDGASLLSGIALSPIVPDLCLIDINMPNMDGFQFLKEVKQRYPDMKCLVLTVFEHEPYIIQMIKHGANGYLQKSCNPSEIVMAIKAICQQGFYYSSVAGEKIYTLVKEKKVKELKLNHREIMLLQFACSELSYGDIAKEMAITFKTLDGVRERLFVKLNISSRVGLAMSAINLGYATIPTAQLVS